MLKSLLSLALVVGLTTAHPQYGPQQTTGGIVQQTGGYDSCPQYEDCVPLAQCVDGWIDTSGAGQLDLRGKPEQIAKQAGYTLCGLNEYTVEVCCKIQAGDIGGPPIGGAIGGGIVGGGGYVDGSSGAIHGGNVGGGAVHGGNVGGGAVHGGAVGGGIVGGGDYVDPAVHGSGAVHGGAVGGAIHSGTVGGGAVHGGAVGGVVGGGDYVDPVGGIHGSAPVSGPPYPSCSAGLLCVEEAKCNLYTGFIGDRIPLYEGQPFIEYKHCTTEYLDVGVCCQETPVDGYVDTSAGVGVGVGGVGVGGVAGSSAHSGGVVGGAHGDAVVGGGAHGGAVVGGGDYGGVGGAVVGSGAHGGAVVGSGAHGGAVVGSGAHGGAVVGSGAHGGVVGGGAHGGAVVGGGDYAGVGGGAVVGGGAHGGAVVGQHGAGVAVGGGDYAGTAVGGVSAAVSVQCGVHEECTLKEYCEKGWIVTDGSGLIDLRTKFKYNKCIDPEYPSAEAVCCRIDTAPVPVDFCPHNEVCTDYQFCDPNGFVSTSPYSPQYSSGTECYHSHQNSALTGVCCKPACPSDSVCIPESLCFGDIMDQSGAFNPYAPGGSYAQCNLIGQNEPGTCCINPIPTEPTPAKCGVSQYAQTNSLKTRYKTPAITKLEADFGEFPWQAIVFYSNYTFRCGATIISDKHLLTAAHCVRDSYPQDFRIRVGEWQVNTFTEPYPYHDYELASITLHQKYRRGAEHNNIAILELASPLTLAYNVNTACLPSAVDYFTPGTRCFVSGWGKDSFVGEYQHILKKVDVPLVDHYVCQTQLRKTRLGPRFRLDPGFLCAGGEEGKDACTGDGGGPLVCLDPNGQYVLTGITSWGIGCGVKDVPGVYADVSKYTDWIVQTISGGSNQQQQYGR